MDSVTGVMPVGSTVGKGKMRSRLFVAGYLAGIAVATIGWVSALGWVVVRTLGWLLT
ncbi:hypothetical protein [Bradyrhizobium sp.]|uniref:hypothetical protein n=1 Tax=Bradyrhizobium sp. TaxID=376 RepID=UPI00261FFAE3|nr:hypothetical protein [Bradyrhizobium sp.]